MTVRVNKPSFNLREKLSELDYSHVPYDKMPMGSVIQMSHIYLDEVNYSSGTFQTGYTHQFKLKRSNSELIHHFWAKARMNNTTLSAGQEYRVLGGSPNLDIGSHDTIIESSWQNYWNRSDYSSDFYPPCDFIMSHKPGTTDLYNYAFQGRVYGGSQASWQTGRTNMNTGTGPSNNRGSWVIYEVAQ